jgi:hypothetical protein
MKALVVAIAVVCGPVLMHSSPALSGDREPLTPEQAHAAYQACLYENWVHEWCHANSSAYTACVYANGGGRYPLDGKLFTEDYCARTAFGLPPRSFWPWSPHTP